jgi:crossover junction endodeoxyribonuclease RuvC
MIFIGIDPGKSGGFAEITEYASGDITYKTFPWDDVLFTDFLSKLKRTEHSIIAIVEKVSAMPNQGVVSMFNFGKSCGFIEGALTQCHIPYQLIIPQRWKREFSLNKSKDDSILVCKHLFPDANLMRNARCIKPSDGMAEALLIAEYGRRLYKRGGSK